MNTFNLENGPKIEPGFKIPDDYFENFSSRVMGEISKQEIEIPKKKESKVYQLFVAHKQKWIAVAAILVISIGIFKVWNLENDANLEQSQNNLTVENYLASHENISDFDLISELEDDDVQILESKMKVGSQEIQDDLEANPNLEAYILETN